MAATGALGCRSREGNSGAAFVRHIKFDTLARSASLTSSAVEQHLSPRLVCDCCCSPKAEKDSNHEIHSVLALSGLYGVCIWLLSCNLMVSLVTEAGWRPAFAVKLSLGHRTAVDKVGLRVAHDKVLGFRMAG